MTDLLDQRESTTGEPRGSRRRWLWMVAAAVIAVVAFLLVWFQPHKLFIDDRVDEAIPTAAPGPLSTGSGSGPVSSTPAGAAEPVEPVEVARGDFVSIDHGTTGVARVLELADGRRVVRLEGLDTSNGPDLYLYLTANPAGGEEAAFDDEVVNLGRLKGNQGDQNYDLPAGTDLTRFPGVVIWCDRFDSAFGAADLNLA
jgi:hypothetical protein